MFKPWKNRAYILTYPHGHKTHPSYENWRVY
ncbi:hypothetical protein F383_01840 [Gossypium arboreum]|uniref:Uncharacterized protein n=1 Tax=Gossypium arboreum TaxID=29729 RepID=A0A0B0PEV0_GOSAR|nr:hypothetical protein F383_01840 [Gossypium arboreum]